MAGVPLGLLDRYILRLIAPGAALGSGVFLFALLLNELIVQLRVLVTQGADPGLVLFALACLVPALLAVAIPSALLFGVLLAFSRLTAGSELLAMRAGGVSPARLLAPVAVAALFGFLATLFLTLEAVPRSNQRFLEISSELASSRLRAEIDPRVFYDELLDDKVLLIGDAPAGGDWERVFLADMKNERAPTVYAARRARMVVAPQDRIAYLELFEVESHDSPDQNPGRYRIQRAERIRVPVDPTLVFGPETPSPRRDARAMRLPELVAGWEGTEAPVYLVEIHKKFTLPFACAAFGIIGLGLGLSPSAGGARSGGFVIAAAVVLLYYIPLILGEELAISGELPPWVAMWFANIGMVGTGLLLLLLRSRGFDPQAAIRQLAARALPGTGDRHSSGHRLRLFPRRLPFPKVGDRYLLSRFAIFFGAGLAVLASMQIVGRITRVIGDVFENDIPAATFARFLALSQPDLLLDMLPLATLAATLVTFGVLRRNRELIAFRAGGISGARLTAPILLGGLLAASLAWLLQERVLPAVDAEVQELEAQIEGEVRRTTDPLDRHWIRGPRGSLFHYRTFDPASGYLEGLSIFTPGADGSSLKSRSYLGTAHWSVTEGVWNGIGGWTRDFGERAAIRPFANRPFPDIPPPASFLDPDLVARQLTRTELQEQIRIIEATGHQVPELRVDLERRFSAPLAPLVAVLIGLPFAFSRSNRGALAGVGFAIAISILYLVANRLFGFLGDAGVLEPVLAAWTPNLFFGLVALLLILRPSE